MKISGTFDIECAAWDKFAVAATFRPGIGKTIHRSIASLVDSMLAVPKSSWWAHAGGAYDFLAVAEEMRSRGIPVALDLAGPRVSRLVGGGITLRDSWPLVPLSLSDAAELANERAPVLGFACRCGAGCGGYCSIRRGDRRAQLAEYCAEDCRVLYAVLASLRELAADLQLNLKGTLGGTAWATARDELGLDSADLPPAIWRRVRAAYYGGRITIVRPHAEGPGHHWDISSAYPHALATTAVPCGDWTPYGSADALLCLGNDRPGVYACEVTVPEMMYPPLPVRVGGRTAYPTGTFRGAWTYHELRAAEVRGVSIDKVIWCICWEREAVLFEDFIERIWAARSRAGKSSALGKWLRLVPNSLGGKFAESPDRTMAKLFPDEVVICNGYSPCDEKRCSGLCGAYDQLDLWGQLWAVPIYRPAPSGHVQWAAYMTAATRERWMHAAEQMGPDVVYGHTDSLWTTSNERPQPERGRLGDWEYKHAWSEWECAGPSAYRYRDSVHRDGGNVVIRTAGAKLTPAQWDAGHATQTRGVLPLATAAATGKGLFVSAPVSWSVPTRGRETGYYGDRLLDTDSGYTVPMPYGTLKKTAQGLQAGSANPKGNP